MRSKILGQRGGAACNGAGEGFIERHGIGFQQATGGDVHLRACAAVIGEGVDFYTLSSGEVALCLDDEEGGGTAEGIFFLFGFESLVLKATTLDCGLVAGTGLLEGDDRVGDFQSDRIHLTHFLEFLLAELEGVVGVVRAGGAVEDRNIEREAHVVVGEVAAGDLADGCPIVTDEVGVGIARKAGDCVERIDRTRQAVVGEAGGYIERGQECASGTLQANFGVEQVELGLFEFRAFGNCFFDECADGRHRSVGSGNADLIGRNDAGVGYGGTGNTGAAERILDDGFLLEELRLADGKVLFGTGDFGFGADDFDGRDGADFDLLLLVGVELGGYVNSLALDLDVFIERDQVPVQIDDGTDRGDDLEFEGKVGDFEVDLGDADVAVVDCTSKALQQTLADLRLNVVSGKGVQIVVG